MKEPHFPVNVLAIIRVQLVNNKFQNHVIQNRARTMGFVRTRKTRFRASVLAIIRVQRVNKNQTVQRGAPRYYLQFVDQMGKHIPMNVY